MKRIKIRHLGPIAECEIHLNRLNVIVGPQSSGKSCVLKVASCCSWAEKRMAQTQNLQFFDEENSFVAALTNFHNLQGYFCKDTYIEYESPFMYMSYRHADGTFVCNWKEGRRWEYKASKVSYIPAERNVVAVIPNWLEVKFASNNILSFLGDWDEARRNTVNSLPLLNLGVAYHFHSETREDRLRLSDDVELPLAAASSGLQSLIPLYVYLHYLFVTRLTKPESARSIAARVEQSQLKDCIEEEFNRRYENGDLDLSLVDEIFANFTAQRSNTIFLEEPEENLFPPTQSQLIDWLLELLDASEDSSLLLSTHSPYIITSLLEQQRTDFALLLTLPTGDGRYRV